MFYSVVAVRDQSAIPRKAPINIRQSWSVSSGRWMSNASSVKDHKAEQAISY
jgi:hypothetical protein